MLDFPFLVLDGKSSGGFDFTCLKNAHSDRNIFKQIRQRYPDFFAHGRFLTTEFTFDDIFGLFSNITASIIAITASKSTVITKSLQKLSFLEILSPVDWAVFKTST